MERLQEEASKFGTWIWKMRQEQASFVRNIEIDIEEMMIILAHSNQEDSKSTMETKA